MVASVVAMADVCPLFLVSMGYITYGSVAWTTHKSSSALRCAAPGVMAVPVTVPCTVVVLAHLMVVAVTPHPLISAVLVVVQDATAAVPVAAAHETQASMTVLGVEQDDTTVVVRLSSWTLHPISGSHVEITWLAIVVVIVPDVDISNDVVVIQRDAVSVWHDVGSGE
jgi:hypothetical protein